MCVCVCEGEDICYCTVCAKCQILLSCRSGHFNTLPSRGKNRLDTSPMEMMDGKNHNTLPPAKVRSHSLAVEPPQPLVLNKPRKSVIPEQAVVGIKSSASADDLDKSNFVGGDGIGGIVPLNNRGSFRDSGIEQSPRSSTSGTLSNQDSPPHSLYHTGSNEHIVNGSTHSSSDQEVPPPIPMKKSRQHKSHSIDILSEVRFLSRSPLKIRNTFGSHLKLLG